MTSTQMLAQVIQTTGATRADVIRVATSGGTTRTDWAIAHAIEAAGGRSAYELMLLAGREEEVAQIWADSRDQTPEVAPTNPKAKYDKTIRVYPEQTSPEENREVIAHHPGDPAEVVEDQEQAEVAKLRTLAWAAIANLTRATKDAIDRMVSKWQTRRAVHAGFTNVMRTARSTRAARLRETYVAAA
ncbi:hypothetical protein [Nocardiopsis sp. L17-MgMaSL7]|uniref:hypothetical protein n=1 Tax=Nocardiopsis sp. L17-MgMaSL7 TaxID=1938893 RepID=UPI000D70DE34|nr:hypothetical protein [Nocardiopsis sp. L17-MgMaSL7]PWV44547.1 hypothetical protein BDW27_1236 [Nocardiopsis sp. L17-MgMaSL7]